MNTLTPQKRLEVAGALLDMAAALADNNPNVDPGRLQALAQLSQAHTMLAATELETKRFDRYVGDSR